MTAVYNNAIYKYSIGADNNKPWGIISIVALFNHHNSIVTIKGRYKLHALIV